MKSPAEKAPVEHRDSLVRGIVALLLSAFPAFESENFRRYFPGQVISMIGTWMQMVAQGWLVLEITGSAFDVGLAAAASTLPPLFLSLFGGVIVDRYPRRTILLWTQSTAMLLAFVLGLFAVTGTVTLWIILVLSFLLGCVNALNVPALQAFLSEIVKREHLASAIAMNSAIYNVSRVIGPALAGLLIASTGSGAAFLVNGFSFFAVLIALVSMKEMEKKACQQHQPQSSAGNQGWFELCLEASSYQDIDFLYRHYLNFCMVLCHHASGHCKKNVWHGRFGDGLPLWYFGRWLGCWHGAGLHLLKKS